MVHATHKLPGTLVKINGAYVTVRGGKTMPGHNFCHRRHQSVESEKAWDITASPSFQREVCISR